MAGAAHTDFTHPRGIYSVSYPAAWETVVENEGRSCGFGPRDRNDVGLWISVLPVRVDTEQADLRPGLRKILEQVAREDSLANVRDDATLRHSALTADNVGPGLAGRFWLVSGGDLVLFASTDVPAAAREEFGEAFDAVMASLRIHRDEELRRIQVANELLRRLQEHSPDQGYRFDPDRPGQDAIRGRDHVVFPGNLFRRVQEDPGRRSALIGEFVKSLSFGGDDAPSAETLDAVRDLILPVPKPAAYFRFGSQGAGLVRRAWLGGLCVCFAIQGRKTLRFVLERDRERWGVAAEDLHVIALRNLGRRRFPEKFPADRPREGLVILLSSGSGMDASTILHPRLHEVFSPVLGSPFLAAIPDRATLALIAPGDPALVARLAAQNREDFRRAAYPVSPVFFVVGPGGVCQHDPPAGG